MREGRGRQEGQGGINIMNAIAERNAITKKGAISIDISIGMVESKFPVDIFLANNLPSTMPLTC